MRIPQKLIDKALRDYAVTKSVFKTAKRVGLGSSTIHRILKANGVERVGLQEYRRSRQKLPTSDVLVSEYGAGASLNDLAKKYDCQPSSVSEALKRYGVQMRPRGNHAKVITAEEAAEIARDYAELGSQAAVAALRNTHQIRVSRALRMAGVKSRRNSGDEHPSWKGGRIRTGAYVSVLVTDSDPIASMRSKIGYVLEHRAVMARALGRVLAPYETVHHINGDTADNRIENLQLRFGKHGKGVAMVCKNCGSHDITYQVLK